MYRKGCVPFHADIRCLSLTGFLFTILFTYTGFALLLASVLWSADLPRKVAAAWARRKRGRQGRALPQQARAGLDEEAAGSLLGAAPVPPART